MQKRVLVVSSANMDFTMNVGRMPEAGQTVIEPRGYAYAPGGKGANAAITLARLGADCVFCARLGTDAHAQRLRSLYIDEGIDVRFLQNDRIAATGLASIIVTENGENRIIVYPGANSNLHPDDVEDAITCIPDAVFLQLEIPDKAVIAATQFAKQKKIPVFLDAGPVKKDFPLDLLGPLEVISPNESETYALTGIMPTDVNSCLRAATKLMQRVETKYVVIKLGSRGAYIHDGKYSQLLTAYETDVVDTTGAGDAFTAAMTLEYLNSGDISRAVRYANAVGAIVVSREGASTSIPTKAQLDTFIDRNGITI